MNGHRIMERPIDKPNFVQESNANRWDPEKVELFHNSVVDENEIKKHYCRKCHTRIHGQHC